MLDEEVIFLLRLQATLHKDFKSFSKLYGDRLSPIDREFDPKVFECFSYGKGRNGKSFDLQETSAICQHSLILSILNPLNGEGFGCIYLQAGKVQGVANSITDVLEPCRTICNQDQIISIGEMVNLLSIEFKAFVIGNGLQYIFKYEEEQ